MIQEDLTNFKDVIKTHLDPRRLKLNGESFVLPDKESLSKPIVQDNFIYSIYLTLLEGYASNVLKDGKFELLDDIKVFMEMPLVNVDR